MKCAVGNLTTDQEGSVEYDKILAELGQTGGDKIEIAPKGCKPVSESQCKSGFMAPSENITFPENALATCCKCQEGELCAYCADKNKCTDAEKAVYVTKEKECFGEKAIGPSPQEAEAEIEIETVITNNKWYILAAIVLIILLIIAIRRRFFTRPSIQIQ